MNDDVYEALQLVLGDLISPEELISKMGPTQSDVHILGADSTPAVRGRKNRSVKKKPSSVHLIPISKAINFPWTNQRKKTINNFAKGKPMAKPPKPNARRQKTINDFAKGKPMKNPNMLHAQEMGAKHLNKMKLGAAGVGAVAAGWGLKSLADKNKPYEPVIKSLTWDASIQEIDKEKRHVFGFATVTHVNGAEIIDKQGDYIPLEEIEKAAYNYVLTSRKGGDMHERDGENPKHTADLIESVVFNEEKAKAMGISDAPNFGWWIGMHINDDKQWDMVKSGERQGFSIHGRGRRTDR